MRTLIFTALLYLGMGLSGFAQSFIPPGRTCATEAYLGVQQQQDPNLKLRQQQLQQQVQQALAQQGQGQSLQADVVITIPVVFHVVYTSPAENISDEAIKSQLEVLNADFRRRNADTLQTPEHFRPFAADTKIQFCLASVDPNGNPTTGITRTASSSAFDYTSDNVKHTERGGIDIWDRNLYLNIWVCRIKGDVLGYAASPGARAASDGVVIHYTSVGSPPSNAFVSSYNRGRTATHEVGHWLGLNHIWGNGYSCSDSDGIEDTPNQMGENGGCHTGIKISCEDSPFGDMYQNYMDYTDDACMNIFTKGQACYMQTLLATSRSTILNAITCSNRLRADFRTTALSDTLTTAGASVQFTDASQGVRPASWYWEFEGGVPAISTQEHPVVTYPQPGMYSVKLTIANESQSSNALKEKFVHVTVNDLIVYPNPSSDYIIIEQPARIWVRQLELVNQLGQVLVKEETRDRVLRLDVRHLPQGVYILRIKSSNGTETRKISVVR
ncbi:T9SS type A sorting domain-containing protein [Pontibacter sp. CAU 1760]